MLLNLVEIFRRKQWTCSLFSSHFLVLSLSPTKQGRPWKTPSLYVCNNFTLFLYSCGCLSDIFNGFQTKVLKACHLHLQKWPLGVPVRHSGAEVCLQPLWTVSTERPGRRDEFQIFRHVCLLLRWRTVTPRSTEKFDLDSVLKMFTGLWWRLFFYIKPNAFVCCLLFLFFMTMGRPCSWIPKCLRAGSRVTSVSSVDYDQKKVFVLSVSVTQRAVLSRLFVMILNLYVTSKSKDWLQSNFVVDVAALKLNCCHLCETVRLFNQSESCCEWTLPALNIELKKQQKTIIRNLERNEM